MVDYNQFSIQIYNNINSNPRGPTPTQGPNGSYLTKKWNDFLTEVSGDVTDIETQVSSNTTNISSNSSSLNALDGRIATNETNFNTLDSRIATNETNLNSLDGRIATNETNISSHDSRILSLESGGGGTGGGLTSNQILVRTDNFDSTVNPTEYQDFYSQGGALEPKIIVHHFPFYLPFYYFDGTNFQIRDLSSNGKEFLFTNNSLTVGGIFDVNESSTHTDISSVFDENGEGYYFISLALLDINISGDANFFVLANHPMYIWMNSKQGGVDRFCATQNERFYNTQINYPTSQGKMESYNSSTSWTFKWDMLILREKYVQADFSLNYNAY